MDPVDQQHGIVMHLPVGKGECTLYEVDIAAGWEAVQLAVDVRAWRKRRDLAQQIPAITPAVQMDGPWLTPPQPCAGGVSRQPRLARHAEWRHARVDQIKDAGDSPNGSPPSGPNTPRSPPSRKVGPAQPPSSKRSSACATRWKATPKCHSARPTPPLSKQPKPLRNGAQQPMAEFKTIEVPTGRFIGWGRKASRSPSRSSVRPGRRPDYNNNICPS